MMKVLRLWTRIVSAGLIGSVLSACSEGGGSFAPLQHRASSAAKTTHATFTIKWTNAAAPASVRHKDTISPSAQSIAVNINGTLNTVANRTSSPSQSIVLTAPVGQDQFGFTVYDLPNAQGHLLGSATVTQQIVDGAANMVTAVIQAVCAVTNVNYVGSNDPLAYPTFGASGVYAQTLQNIVLAGKTSATLTVGPEDADGNVIIAQTGGTVPATITGSASITPIDGAHIQLTPVSGPRTTTPDTLTVAAPGCPSTTVGVQHSPAIYVLQNDNFAFAIDWYGHELVFAYPSTGEVFIGYDTNLQQIMAYNTISGVVSSYSLSLTTRTPLYTILPNSKVAWSNFSHSVFAAVNYMGAYASEYYTYANGAISYCCISSPGGPPTAVAASTHPYANYAFASNGDQIFSFTMSSSSVTFLNSVPSAYPVEALATNDDSGLLYSFSSGTPYVSAYAYSLGAPSNGNYSFGSAVTFGATDTDAGNIYAILSDGYFNAATSAGAALPIGETSNGQFYYFNTSGPGLAVVVISTNE